jgi:hypothetical protein
MLIEIKMKTIKSKLKKQARERVHPLLDEEANTYREDEQDPGPTGHGPDICYSDADPCL